jgi:rhodanese-related sulfurtransferase
MFCFVTKNMAKSFLLAIICFFIFCETNAQNNYNEVTLPELMKKLQEKDTNMIIVDVRTHGEYYDTSSRYQQSNIGRIKGAINIPLQDFRKDPATVHLLDAYKGKDIYVICSHSYRSRVVSNILLDSGFTHVNNTRGGMTEFFRRYNEVAPFKNEFYETSIKYKNIAPAQLLEQLAGNKNPLLISISNTPKFFWDSLNLVFYKYYPSFKNAVNFNYGDSLKILELVQKDKNRPVVLFNTTNYGAAELAGWLTREGISNVTYLVGGADLFYEYLLNENLVSGAGKFLTMHSNIHFITPSLFCNKMSGSKDAKIIDLRHDTLFNKITKGTKYNYKHLKDAVNFFAGKGMQEFEQQFPDKKTGYIFISENGIDGIEFADDLTKKGYTISWTNGGMQEWEWYMNNVETFKCMDYLVK